MTDVPIIKIPVDSSEFESFVKQWDEYKETLDKMPPAFQALNKRVAEFRKLQMSAGVSAGASLDAALKMEGALKKVTAQQERGAVATQKSAKAFRKMADDTYKIGKGILSITGHLAKWGGMVGALGLGAGFLGMDALADSAMGQQRSARGMGVSIGQQSAMRINMSRLFDPNTVMSKVADASNIPQDSIILARTGVPIAQLKQMGSFNATLKLAAMARTAWKENPALAEARFGGIFQKSDMRRMAAMSNSEFAKTEASARADVNPLSISNRTAHEWTLLSVQLSRARLEIEKTLITGLAPLAPQFAYLSQELNQVIKTGIHDFSGGIEASATGIKDFAKFLGSPAFAQDMRTFGDAISQLGQEMVNALRYFHLIPQATPSWNALVKAGDDTTKGIRPNSRAVWFETHGPQYSPAHIAALNAEASKKYGVPVGILNRLSYDESGYGKHLFSPKGAVGVDQLMPGTAAMLHVNNPMNAHQNIFGAALYLHLLNKHYADWNKTVGAFNAGPGTIDSKIAAHGKNWLQYAPKQTQGEVANVVGANSAKLNTAIDKMLRIATTKQANSYKYVTISNATAAHVAVSANALAAGAR